MDELGRQKKVSSVSGLAVNHGGSFGEEWEGVIFASESAGCTVAAYKPNHPFPETTNYEQLVYPDEEWGKVSFLTTTDDRFRPVNTNMGPDGCLYVVDFARGNVQHKKFLTSYLRRQLEELDLDQSIDRGRIYRIVPKAFDRAEARLKPAGLLEGLRSKNLWWRLDSQKKIVQGKKVELVSELRSLIISEPVEPLTRVHALWTLSGLGKIDEAVIKAALDHEDWFVVMTGLRLAGEAFGEGMDFPPSFLEKAKELGAHEVSMLADYAKEIVSSGYSMKRVVEKKAAAIPSHISKNPGHKALWKEGEKQYQMMCGACHQNNGEGLVNMAPTLKESDWVTGAEEKLIATVVHGVSGEIHINGKLVKDVPPIMPPHAHLNDQQIAQILTYIRNSWGNSGAVVDPESISKYREKYKNRKLPWTEKEMKKLGL